uniref:Hsc70-interacting protein 2 n=2 Tax=Bactrocera latifrons TaxID=174628 RepID=A0A0K8UVB8_BACLA
MAMPNFSHADLEKLKFFINFVSEYPTALNLPQLEFVKEFLEKFGGKVPTGEFKMPTSARGKCPFGADAASCSGMNVDESEESELEESEPESEVELDMEARTKHKRKKPKSGPDLADRSVIVDNFINTSTVYLEETKVIRKQPIKTERENSDCEENNIEEYECQVEAIYDTDERNNIGEEDPIKTNATPIAMKFEIDSDCENEDLQDENYKGEDASGSDESSEMVLPRIKTRSCRRKLQSKKGKRYTKNRHFYTELKPEKKVRKPKPVNCNGKCKKQCSKIDEDQRMKLCKEFWSLGFVERKNYLLSCVEKKPLGKMRIIKRVKEARQHTNHYFMPSSDGERVRVCLGFFLKTLVISGYLVKDALEHNDGKGHYTGIDLRGGSGEGRRLKTEIAKQRRDNSVEDPVSTEDNSVTEETSEHIEDFGIKEMVTNNADLLHFKTNKQSEENETVPVKITDERKIEKTSSLSAQENNSAETEVVLAGQSEAVTSSVQKTKTNSCNRPTRKGISIKKDRVPQPVNCAESCRFKCHTKFTEEQRALLCAAFWRLSYKRRKDFVLSRVEVHENTNTTAAEHRKTTRVRVYTNRYFLRGERGENVRVCSRFFNTTLCIGSHFLANAQKNVDKQTGAYAGEDRRGRNGKKNKFPEELIAGVREHINSYPTWVPHKNYKTRFLHSSLNIMKMYAEYKEDCERQNKIALSPSYFRRVFHKDFKLAFLQPTSKHAHKVSSQRKCIETVKTDTTKNSTNANVDATLAVDSKLIKVNAAPATKKLNPNISTFTGEEGGFWTQLTPNATETMRFLQQRYAPQAPTPVIVPTIYHHQQQLSAQQPPPPPPTTQMQPQQQQLPPTLMPTSAYQLLPQAAGYVHQPHIMNAGYESEERAQNFHML